MFTVDDDGFTIPLLRILTPSVIAQYIENTFVPSNTKVKLVGVILVTGVAPYKNGPLSQLVLVGTGTGCGTGVGTGVGTGTGIGIGVGTGVGIGTGTGTGTGVGTDVEQSKLKL